MNKKLLESIRHLSEQDKKVLSQKTLKATEEIGELAKAVLPFENAYATTHRFVDREKILEECADSMLVILSIAYDMGFKDDEIEQMMEHKMKVWADLQAREEKAKFPLPYEIHVTVSNNDMDLDKFKDICEGLNVKPILLDLHLKNNEKIKDLMTSSTFMGDNRTAYEEMKRISERLKCVGFEVVREKIETIPWHPAAPSLKHETPKMPPHCYFECHLNVFTNENNLSLLSDIANIFEAKRSQNIFKRIDNENVTIMVTYRSYDKVYEEFSNHLKALKSSLDEAGFDVAKEIVEFSIYDTKVSHDAGWINS